MERQLMTDSVVQCSYFPGHALIRLNRPAVHNAINEEAMDRLEEILDELEKRAEIVSVILTGSGEATFCAGGDLRYFRTLRTREQALRMSRRMQAILERFYHGRRVCIAAVNGQAYGGGCEILTACHFRIAVPDAQFSFRQAANGVITGWGGGVRLFRLLGRSRALRLLTTSETIDTATAVQMGLVDQVVPRDALLGTAAELARRIAANPAPAVRGYLELLRTLDEQGAAAAAEVETNKFADLWVEDDFQSWLAKFFKKSHR